MASIDEIIGAPLSPRERLRKYFPLGKKFKIGIFDRIQLHKLIRNPEDGKIRIGPLVTVDSDFIAESRQIRTPKGFVRWLVHADPKTGDPLFGASIDSFIGEYKAEHIDIDT